MKAEFAVLLVASLALLVIGLFGGIFTETRTIVSGPSDDPVTEVVQIRPYLPAGITSMALGVLILLILVVLAVATKLSRR